MYADINPTKIFKYCPVCGSETFETIGSRTKKCKKCSFTYYFNVAAAVAGIIFDKNGRILLVRRGIQPFLGKMDLPGGFVEPFETAEESLIREIKEELGITIKEPQYCCSFPNEYPFSGIDIYTLDFAFRINIDPSVEMIPKDDISGFKFYKAEDIPWDQLQGSSMIKIIKTAIKQNIKK